jgi:hypothetical protein
MTRVWIAVALLAASWVALLGYYHQPDWMVGSLLLVLGVLLLGEVMPVTRAQPLPSSASAFPPLWYALTGAAMLVPTVAIAPWPYKTAPILLLAGLAGTALVALDEDGRRPWTRTVRWLAGSLVAGGAILLMQTLALTVYEACTARDHELPHRLSAALAGLANLVGIKAAVDGNNNIVMYAFRLPQRLAATWELFLDPFTLGFLVGGLTLLVVRACLAQSGARRTWRPMLVLALCVLGWLPVRVLLHMSVYMHRVLRTEYDAPIDLMDQFWSTWVNLFFLAGAVFLAAVFVRVPALGQGTPDPQAPRPRRIASAVLVALGVAAVSAAIFWNPPGARKGGRVLVDEYHSKWEDTRRPFDTTWYGHESTYQFYAAFDYLGHFYRTGRIEQPITPAVLAECDVLIVKVPTSPYTADELETIRKFVEGGGGLLLIGEHTNVFGTGDCINPLARIFGFVFRADCLFDIDRKFFQANRSAVVPHPVLQYLPRENGNGRLDWVVSCSIDPQGCAGRAVIESIGLKNLPADYYANNFYPQVNNHPYMRYGAFTQVWAGRYGKGRVVGFGDSTQLSNFCAFEPGKSELQMGMVEWLNRREGLNPRAPLLAVGAFALVLALWIGRGRGGDWVLMLAAGLLGWSGAAACVNAAHAAAMRPPQPIKPMVRVVMDETVSVGKLPMGGFISGQEDGFGIFEMWMLRQGYFYTRRSGPDVFRDANVVVFAYPRQPVTDEFREHLRRYVEAGGRVLILDAIANKNSTANSLLLPFRLTAMHEAGATGALQLPPGWLGVNVTNACLVTGGQPLARVNGQPVAAFVRYGKGTVTVIGFGDAFNDLHMGVLADVVPNQQQQQLFELEYSFMRLIVDDTLEIVSLPPVQAVPPPPMQGVPRPPAQGLPRPAVPGAPPPPVKP